MARPRTSTKVLELRGAFKHDPQRLEAREGEPQDLELFDPAGYSEDWPEHVIQAWKEIVAEAPPCVLTVSDRKTVELAAFLMAEFRELTIEMRDARLAQLIRVLGLLGMNPADRSRVKVVKVEKKSRLQEALEGVA